MLNIDHIRRAPDEVAAALARRGEEPDLATLLRLDQERRVAITERDDLRATHNQLSREFGQLMAASRSGGGDPTRLEELRAETQSLNDRVEELGTSLVDVEASIETMMLELPNLPLDSTPDGLDETANLVVRSWGEARQYDFTPLAHWDLGEKLDLIDMERGAKLSGARFYVLKGPAARLERALISWMLDVHTRDHGYTEMALPAMVREQVMLGSGNLPKFGDNLYRDVEEDLWLLPTAEVALTGLHRDEILAPGAMPLKYVAQTPCFRREKAAAGRDTRGIQTRPPVQQGGDVPTGGAGAQRGGVGVAGGGRVGFAAEAGAAASRVVAVRRRHGFPVGQDLRHRSMVARLRGMA